MQSKPVILTMYHREHGETWTHRERYATRDEAIDEGRNMLDMDPAIRQFTVDSYELRAGHWEVLLTYRETTWRSPQ